MEYNLEKQSIYQLKWAIDTVSEQPVDIDLTLPDYCPDIERILCCKLIPKIYMANLSSDRLNIEGGSCVRLMYIDGSRGCVRTYEYTQPFSESVPMPEQSSDCAVFVDAKPEYMNCRALSPRKLSLHGAFSLHMRAAVSDKTDYYDCIDSGLQIKREETDVSELCGLCSESFTVQEEISAGGKSEMTSVLSHRMSARITELKAIHNKIMLNAELKLELMYQSGADKCQAECMSYSLPVSRVIDCEGVDENSVIDGRLDVMSGDVRLGGDALDGSALLSCDAKLIFSALCWADRKIEIMTDAFSTQRDIEARYSPFSCCCGMVCKSYTDIGKANISADDSIARILDVHCEKLTVAPTSSDGIIILTAKLCVSVMYENTDGEIRCIERDAEFIYKPDTDGRDCVESARAALDSLSYRMVDAGSIELRAELRYRLSLCRRKNCSAITMISADEDAPDYIPDSSLILYYTDGGENVWDIAKRFRSRPADIAAENDLDGDIAEGGVMLLIPTA